MPLKHQHDWEYTHDRAHGSADVAHTANEYAKKGWRLHSTIAYDNYTGLVFERPMRYHELVWHK